MCCNAQTPPTHAGGNHEAGKPPLMLITQTRFRLSFDPKAFYITYGGTNWLTECGVPAKEALAMLVS